MTTIALNTESIREEVTSAPLETHGLTQEEADALCALDDATLNDAIPSRDYFWEAYDRLRGEAIAALKDHPAVRAAAAGRYVAVAVDRDGETIAAGVLCGSEKEARGSVLVRLFEDWSGTSEDVWVEFEDAPDAETVQEALTPRGEGGQEERLEVAEWVAANERVLESRGVLVVVTETV